MYQTEGRKKEVKTHVYKEQRKDIPCLTTSNLQKMT